MTCGSYWCSNAQNSQFLVFPLILLQFIERILMNDEPFLGICCVDVSLLSFRDDTVVFMQVDCIVSGHRHCLRPPVVPLWVGGALQMFMLTVHRLVLSCSCLLISNTLNKHCT